MYEQNVNPSIFRKKKNYMLYQPFEEAIKKKTINFSH